MVVDLDKSELEGIISTVRLEGILACVASASKAEEQAILKRVEKW